MTRNLRLRLLDEDGSSLRAAASFLAFELRQTWRVAATSLSLAEYTEISQPASGGVQRLTRRAFGEFF